MYIIKYKNKLRNSQKIIVEISVKNTIKDRFNKILLKVTTITKDKNLSWYQRITDKCIQIFEIVDNENFKYFYVLISYI